LQPRYKRIVKGIPAREVLPLNVDFVKKAMASHALNGRKEKEGKEEEKANHCRVTRNVSLQSKKER